MVYFPNGKHELGAKALDFEQQIGSIEVGKQADLIVVDAATPRMTPLINQGSLFNLHTNLVHAVQGQDVVMTMAAGKVLVKMVNCLMQTYNNLLTKLILPHLHYLNVVLTGSVYAVQQSMSCKEPKTFNT